MTEQTKLFEEEENIKLSTKQEVVWVSIEDVIPNPLNPRKEDSIKTEEMQEIIKKRGWEEPLVVYQKGKMYVLLAGHRRLFAAKKAKETAIPVYVVEQPKNKQEELERIASLQSGRVDWTPYEWARFVYDRWIAWGKPAKSPFARQINIGVSSVKQYITVLDYFPTHEIDTGLHNKTLKMTALDSLVKWLKALRKHKPDLVEAMTEDMIRQIMIEKIKNRKASNKELKNLDYVQSAKEKDIKAFLLDKDMQLDSQIGYLGIEKKFKSFRGHLVSISAMENRIPNIKPETEHQKEQAKKYLEDLQGLIEKKLSEIK